VAPAARLVDEAREIEASCGGVTELTPPVKENPREAHGIELVLGPVTAPGE